MQKNENELFYFSRKEKNGIVLILILNLLIYFSPDVYEHFVFSHPSIKIEKLPQKTTAKELDNENTISDTRYAEKQSQENQQSTPKLFYFDPNICSKAQWMALGVKEKTATTIVKYISKGGSFKSPEDLKKIWGLSPTQVNNLMPFVRIKNNNVIKNENVTYQKPKEKSQKTIELNKADSSLLESLYGIGPALSKRIIAYRNKLGGFYAVEQLKEVWGLPDTVYEQVKNKVIVSEKITKISINSADFLMLKSHPYIGYKLANTIINYRKQHGNFESLEDIQKIDLIDEKTLNQLSHYLTLN